MFKSVKLLINNYKLSIIVIGNTVKYRKHKRVWVHGKDLDAAERVRRSSEVLQVSDKGSHGTMGHGYIVLQWLGSRSGLFAGYNLHWFLCI